MSTNPFEPPKAPVADVHPTNTASPPLWNPGAAASWSLLFSPIFGAILHMKNWQALGETEKAAQSKNWAIGSIAFFVVLFVLGFVLPDSKALDAGFRAGGFGLLIAWYMLSAKAQIEHVKKTFGTSYPRRGLGRPVLYAVLIFVAFLAVVFVIALIAGLVTGEG